MIGIVKNSKADQMIRDERLQALREISAFYGPMANHLSGDEIIAVAMQVTSAMNRDYTKPMHLFTVPAEAK